MASKLFAGQNRSWGLSLNILTDDELEEIHLGTLELLEKTGIFVENKEALYLFESAGAYVNHDTQNVRIPPHMVEDAIRSAPSKVILYGRDPKHDLTLSGTRVHFTNFSEGVQVIDPRTGERREPVKTDLEDAARVIDYLDDVDFCEKALGAHDVDQASAPLHNAEAFLPNTTKHCAFGPGNGKLLKKIIDMGVAICGSREAFDQRPIISFTTCPVSPLKLIDDCCQIIMESARQGTACNILSMAMAGATAPVTLAGALVTHNAEILGGITLHQLARKGAPVIYGSSTTAMDLRMGTASVGTPEAALVSGAVACLARHYKVPCYVGGTQGDGKVSDAQIGHEKTLTGLIPALAGANMIYGLGMLESGITFDFGQLVMDAEFARMIKHTVMGIPVDDETLAVDVTQKVGPFGDFLCQKHTIKYMRSQSQPEFIDRTMRETWERKGSKTVHQKAMEKVIHILDTHKPAPLPQEVLDKIRAIVVETEKELGVKS